ncbi:MAG: signal peptidase I [Firmicutes bacterium]|nr:signal peptidase I [Bacillota bacterium]
MKEALGWIRDIGIALVIAAIILTFFKPIIIQQESMQPTFYSDDYVIISKQAYTLFGDVERGDVIVFKSDLLDGEGNSKHLIKRIIGIPGDTIEIKNGLVYRNGEKLEEDYVNEKRQSGEMEPIIVEEGKLFVLGDNRRVSQDSRSEEIGQIDQETIVGKVVLRIFPFDKIQTFS